MREILPLDTEKKRDVDAMVRLIADRLLLAGPEPDADMDRPKRALLERIFAYVADAEKRIADRDRRIAYLQGLSMTDELTGLMNRRCFAEQIRRVLAASRRYGHQGLLLYCDLDNFKAINDAHGHAAGDAALKHVAGLLERSVRASDFVARLGGDEFAIALVQTGRRDGLKRARSLQRSVEQGKLVYKGREIALRMSIGDEPFGADDAAEDVISRADMAMYYSKRSRNTAISRQAAQ